MKLTTMTQVTLDGVVQGNGGASYELFAGSWGAIEEMTLLIIPVVLGQGTRLFPGTGPDMAFELVESRADSKGVMIQVYRPAGRPKYAAARRGESLIVIP